jgi:hypothetical protein
MAGLACDRDPSTRGCRLVAAGMVALLWSVGLAGPAAAADPVTFGTPTASSTFGQGVDFNQPVTLPGDQKRIEILISTRAPSGPSPARAGHGTEWVDDPPLTAWTRRTATSSRTRRSRRAGGS